MDLAYELRDLRPDDSDESAFLSKVDTPVPDNSIQLDDAPGCIFTRLPHKDGNENRVGNPLSKSFLDKVKDGVMLAHWDSDDENDNGALRVLRAAKTLSYWKSNQDRVRSQMLVNCSQDKDQDD